VLPFIVGAVLIVVAVVVIAFLVRPRQDPVDSFRRQIDALSPEARRPTIDQVRRADEDTDETEQDDS
jgi:HAMP domain-containing protein